MSDLRRVHFNAGTQPHYTNHIAPIYLGLPEEVRGNFYARFAAADKAVQWGITPARSRKFKQKEVVVVASFEDYRASAPASIIFVNHGIGQTYSGLDLGSYTGGRGRERTILFLGPSRRDAMNSRATYPHIPAAAVGVPYLDRFAGRPKPEGRFIAISSHVDVRVCAETRSAFPEFRDAIRNLALTQPGRIIGHAHPKAMRKLEPFWKTLPVMWEPDWLKVLDLASLYVSDNSSTLYEAAAIGMPVLCMNSKHYRRDVEHGLRFWEAVPGLEVDLPAEFENSVNLAMADPPTLQERRARAVQEAYSGLVDGKATERAVQAILDISISPMT